MEANAPQTSIKDSRCVGGKVAEDLFNHGLCLPSGTAMTEEDLDRVISVILNCKRLGEEISSQGVEF